MIFDRLKVGEDIGDEAFDRALYSEEICAYANTHFTGIDIARKSADFLVDREGVRVLDIGSGTGKFCMLGATFTEGHFVGVEQRLHLHQLAESIVGKYQLKKVDFIHANINVIDFSLYDAFYFYNPFIENISPLEKMDDSVLLEHHLYKVYTNYVKDQLSRQSIGTRLVTYFSESKVVPKNYSVHAKFEAEKLTFWIKDS